MVVIIIRDELEENLKILTDEQLVNPQTNQSINQTLSQSSIGYYKAKLLEHDEGLMEHFHQHNIRYVKVYNADEVMGKLERLFI